MVEAEAEAKGLRPRPRPEFWPRGHFGLEDLTTLDNVNFTIRANSQRLYLNSTQLNSTLSS